MPAQTIGIQPAVPQRVSLAIGNAAKRTGVPFNYLMAQARVESSLDPDAQASSSSAAGLFQFTKQTWLATLSQHGPNHGLEWAADAIRKGADGQYRIADPHMREQILGLRFDPEISSAMAAEFADDNADMLRNRFGEEPEPVDLYLAHFLGAQGASQFLSAWRADPNAPAAPMNPAAAAANRTIFYNPDGSARSLDAIRSHFAARLNEQPSGFPVSGTVRTQMATRTGSNTQSSQEFMQMRTIEPMPQNLSLAFAERAYQRLARIDGGAAA
ncbi:MAG: transglycosylase SLT domain-containing protein [Sphingomonadales bacterium]|nr:transglycosylase SLT domain-containing protein [Sphingomonadales bacterium]